MNRERLTQLADVVLPPAAFAGVLTALYAVFFYAPEDSYQGIVQKIFYIHMSMWMPTFTAFGIVAVASILYLWRRTPIWDQLGCASAEIGLVFCTLGLATGSIWARPIWGSWWTWDPRLTLTTVLWLIYGSYLLLRRLATNQQQGATFSAILGVSGIVDLFLINRAVYWWRGIHPAVIRTREGTSGLADPRMKVALFACLIGFFILFTCLLHLRLRQGRLQDTVEDMRERVIHA